MLDLDAIEARCNAATPGPWGMGDGDAWVTYPLVTYAEDECRDPIGRIIGGADFDFIAHARTDIPALLARVRELEAEVEQLKLSEANLDEQLDLALAADTEHGRAKAIEAAVRAERERCLKAVEAVREIYVYNGKLALVAVLCEQSRAACDRIAAEINKEAE